MSQSKAIFLALCRDAAQQYSIGMGMKNLRENIAFTAENYGIPMFSAIHIAETMSTAVKNLSKSEQAITTESIAREFMNNTEQREERLVTLIRSYMCI